MLTLTEILADFATYAGSTFDVSVTTRSQNGETALHWMATLGDTNAIRLLVAAGADMSAINHEGNTSLHEAVASRQDSAAKMLIDLGANVSTRNLAGHTPQDIAKKDGLTPTITLFMGH